MCINSSCRRLSSEMASAVADGVVISAGNCLFLGLSTFTGLLHLNFLSGSGGRPVEADRETRGGGFSGPQSPREFEIL